MAYTPDILTDSTDLEAVRSYLGVDNTTVSDSLIATLPYQQLVEAQVEAQVTDWSTILTAGGLDALKLKAGTAAWIAAGLCGHLERQEAQNVKIGPFTHQASSVDWSAKAVQLAQEAAGLLAQISTATPDTGRPKLFTVNGPTRSRGNVPSTYDAWLDRIKPVLIDWLDDEQT